MISHQKHCVEPTEEVAQSRVRGGETGASLIEYALILALIAVVCVGAIGFFGSSSGGSVEHSGNCIVNAGGPTPDPDC